MITKTLDFTTLTAANPYVIGSPPDNINGYALTTGSNPVKIFNTGTKEIILASGTRAILYDIQYMTGVTIRSTIKMGSVNGNSRGGGVVDKAGNGYVFITNNVANNFKIYKTVANVLTTLIYTSPTLTPVVNNNYTLERNTTTGVMKLFDNAGTQIGAESPADLTYPNARFACCYLEYGYLRRLTSEFTPTQTVTSINGGSPFTASQTSSSAVTSDFTGLPTAITSNVTGLTFSGIGGTTNAPTFTKSVRTDGAVYPKDGVTATVTFTNGAESASITIPCNKNADETKVVADLPSNDDITCLFGAIYATTGRSAANGDEVYHAIPPAMLTNGIDTILPADAIAPDGTMQFYNAGSFPCWVWTAATGVNYYYSVTITESGDVVVQPGFIGSTIKGSLLAGSILKGKLL